MGGRIHECETRMHVSTASRDSDRVEPSGSRCVQSTCGKDEEEHKQFCETEGKDTFWSFSLCDIGKIVFLST